MVFYRDLDNTATEGADGFQDFLQIIDELERVGAEKDWCKELRKRLQEGKLYLKTKLGKYQAEDYLCEAKNAAAKIFKWRGHILRAEKQDQYKRQIVDTLKRDETFIIVDLTMKFIAMKFREKQAEWFAKRRINWHASSVVVRQVESLEVT